SLDLTRTFSAVPPEFGGRCVHFRPPPHVRSWSRRSVSAAGAATSTRNPPSFTGDERLLSDRDRGTAWELTLRATLAQRPGCERRVGHSNNKPLSVPLLL